MPSLISAARQSQVMQAFKNLHDTFAREITVYKNSKKVAIASSAQYNAIYGRNSGGSSVTYETVSYTINARVYYVDLPEEIFSDAGDASQNKVVLPRGSVRLIVYQDGFDVLKDARRVEFDGKTFSIKSSGVPEGLFGNEYFQFLLTPLDV
jgi:hypothetical protein